MQTQTENKFKVWPLDLNYKTPRREELKKIGTGNDHLAVISKAYITKAKTDN